MESYLHLILQVILWACLAGILFTYGCYPLIMSRLAKRNDNRAKYQKDDDDWPVIHVVMPMFNEENVIQRSLESIVASDYPKGN